MTHQQLLHELGLLILGGSSVHLVMAYAPLPEQPKRLAAVALGLVTVSAMAKVAGLV